MKMDESYEIWHRHNQPHGRRLHCTENDLKKIELFPLGLREKTFMVTSCHTQGLTPAPGVDWSADLNPLGQPVSRTQPYQHTPTHNRTHCQPEHHGPHCHVRMRGKAVPFPDLILWAGHETVTVIRPWCFAYDARAIDSSTLFLSPNQSSGRPKTNLSQ